MASRIERVNGGEIITGDVVSKGVLIPYGNLLIWNDAQLAEWNLRRVPVVDPTPPTPPVVVLTRTYKADIWRRTTDAEAVTIDAALKSQSVRLQRMWSDAQFLETTDDLYPTIAGAFTQAFGATRAAELLQPTE